MRSTFSFVFIFAILFSIISVAGASSPATPQPSSQESVVASPSSHATTATPVASRNSAFASNEHFASNEQKKDEQQALRDDIKRMRVLVQQMETNLAFVDSGQTPLKHQFQLEIEMWRTLINQMERRLNATAR